MTISVIPVGDTREALSLPSIPQTGGRRQTNTQEGGGAAAGRGNFNAHSLRHTHTNTKAHISHYRLQFKLSADALVQEAFWKECKYGICVWLKVIFWVWPPAGCRISRWLQKVCSFVGHTAAVVRLYFILRSFEYPLDNILHISAQKYYL